jgi:VanZ family protein
MFSATPGAEVAESFDALSETVSTLAAPTQSVPALEPAAPSLQIDWLKVGHGIGYFCLGFSTLFALLDRKNAPLLTLTLCAVYALTDEIHQSLTPDRSMSGWDILLDSLAALAGILLLRAVIKRVRVLDANKP